MTATTTLSERIAAAKNFSLKRLPSLERYLEANAIRMPKLHGHIEPQFETSEVGDGARP